MGETKFHGKASAYADARPGYPAEAIDCIGSAIDALAVSGAEPGSGPVIADIGAGTGKFTVPLAGLGHPVFAVEPDGDMRAALERSVADLDDVAVVDGNAEHTTLPDGCVDVVTVAQALHWFDRDAFLAECARIARGGRLLLVSVYNVTSFDSAMETGDALDGSAAHFRRTTEEFFAHPSVHVFDNPIRYTREGWRTFMDSHSHSPLPGDPAYPAHRAWVDEVFDDRAEDGVLTDDNTCRTAIETLRFDRSGRTRA